MEVADLQLDDLHLQGDEDVVLLDCSLDCDCLTTLVYMRQSLMNHI